MNVTISRKNASIVVPDIVGVTNMFPNAMLLPDGNSPTGQSRVIPHGLRETLMLRHLGFKVPNPVDFYYDWVGGKPFNVQRASVRMLTENPRAYLLNHMGTGKTKTALWAWDYLNKCGLAGKAVVVAPLSTLRFVWQREAFVTLPGRKVAVLHGTRAERLDALGKDADIYVVNHDGLRVIYEELRARADIDTLIIDELAVYRNPSARTKLMVKFAEKFDKVWGMTGSPMPNEPTDVWSQCKIITPNTVPRFRGHARELLMLQPSPHRWVPKSDAVDRAFSWMKPAVRYALADVVELPPTISRSIEVPLSPEQQKTYKSVSTAMHTMVKDKVITAVNAGAAMSKLLQIAGGWVYTQNPEFVRLDPTPRIIAMADLIESTERKVLIAIPFRHMLDGISKILGMKQVGIDHCVIHGDTPNREDLFNKFQNTGMYKCALVHPQCVSHGLTLTAADTIIWYLPITSLDTYDQFNARITRIGQAYKQQLLHLQATPVERKVYKMLRDHQKMQANFLDLVEAATGEAV